MRQLSDEAILKIYKEHNWFIFDPDLSRAKAVACKAEQEILRQVVEILEDIPWMRRHYPYIIADLKKQALEGQGEEGK